MTSSTNVSNGGSSPGTRTFARAFETATIVLGALLVTGALLSGLAHRRFDFELVEAAEPLRAEFKAAGWKTLRLLWMHHESPPPPGPEIAVEAVTYDAVHDLRVAWHNEDFPAVVNPASYHAAAREVALRRGAQVLAVHEDGVPVAFAQLERDGDAAAEITQVYVHPDHAAIEAAAGARDLWIAADDEDRPKELYARLGFRPVWTAMEVTLWPS